MTTYKRFFTPPSQSFFLFGPRGSGKSTLMKMLYREEIWIDLLLPQNQRNYLARPERLYDVVEAAESKKFVIIDEIQKVPSLLSVVHSLIEQKSGKKFILTGSSSRKLKRTGADLLGGRALKCTLHPFMAAELGTDFQLDKALKFGMLPLLTGVQEPGKTLEAYVNLYLQEEIQAEGLVRNLDSFSRFLEAMCFSHGSVLNVTNIAQECAVKRKTVENYIQILEDLLLGWKLPIFTKRAKRELSAHPKFYFFDVGVYKTLRPRGPIDCDDELNGASLEGLIAQHLFAWSDYSKEKSEIAFWRTRSGVEVDFIVYGQQGFWAIEVKNSTSVFSSDISSLRTFLVDYPMAKGILLYRGHERFNLEGILCLPCQEFLSNVVPDRPLLA